MDRERAAIIGGLIIVFVLLAYWFYLRDETMLYGDTLLKIELERKQVREEKMALEEEILQKSSLHYIQAESEKRGFRNMNPYVLYQIPIR